MLSCVTFRNLEDIEEWKLFSICTWGHHYVFLMCQKMNSVDNSFSVSIMHAEKCLIRSQRATSSVCGAQINAWSSTAPHPLLTHTPGCNYLNSVVCCDRHELENENVWTAISLSCMSPFMEDQKSCQSFRSPTHYLCLNTCGWMREMCSALLDNSKRWFYREKELLVAIVLKKDQGSLKVLTEIWEMLIIKGPELLKTSQTSAADVQGPQVGYIDVNKPDELKSVNERSLINPSWFEKWLHDEYAVLSEWRFVGLLYLLSSCSNESIVNISLWR